jgi:hypothetical protein
MIVLNMMKKFTQIPVEVQEDVINGRLIGNDLVVYNYLVAKASHGKPIFFSNERIGNDLGGMSYGKISGSLNRLAKAKHIKRKKTCNKTLTQLTTVVLGGDNVIVRGLKK